MTSTSRTYVLTMTKPHETLGIPMPFGRRLAQHASVAWYLIIWAMIFGLVLTYIGFITTSAARGFQLRDAEARMERLQSEARMLEVETAQASSIAEMADRAQEMGFVAVNQIQTVDAHGHSYAFAR